MALVEVIIRKVPTAVPPLMFDVLFGWGCSCFVLRVVGVFLQICKKKVLDLEVEDEDLVRACVSRSRSDVDDVSRYLCFFSLRPCFGCRKGMDLGSVAQCSWKHDQKQKMAARQKSEICSSRWVD